MSAWSALRDYYLVILPASLLGALAFMFLRSVWRAARRRHVWARLQQAFPERAVDPGAKGVPGGVLGLHWKGAPGEPEDTVLAGMSTWLVVDRFAVHLNPTSHASASEVAPPLSIPWTSLVADPGDRMRLIVEGQDRGWIRLSEAGLACLAAFRSQGDP